MAHYRRNRVIGGSYFFTVTLNDQKSTLLIDHLEFLREAVRKTREARPFTIEAWVVLPEHMHAIWTLPPDDADIVPAGDPLKAILHINLQSKYPLIATIRANKNFGDGAFGSIRYAMILILHDILIISTIIQLNMTMLSR